MRCLLVLLAACGPGLKRVPVTGDALVGDATKLRQLLRDSVTNGGLLFDDPACTQMFGVPGEIKSDRFDAFARCLAGLHLEVSARKDALPDAVVLQHAPGIELEARLVNEDGVTLRWIGFASRVEGDVDAPTVTHQALEHLRLAGDRNGSLDPTVTSTLELDVTPDIGFAYTWLKVCLDSSGKVTKADTIATTSGVAAKAFADAIASWKFRPFVTRGNAIPVCAMVRMSHPPQSTAEVLPLPAPPSRSKKRPVLLATPKLLEGKRIAGDRLVVPDDRTKTNIQLSRTRRLVGRFRICIDDTGAVESVVPMESTGYPQYDNRIVMAMHDWRYSPYLIDEQPVPVCTVQTFIYSQN